MNPAAALDTETPRRVLITGGSGFLGAHLAQRCLLRGDEVHLVVRTTSSLWRVAHLLDRVHVHRLELADRRALDACFAAVAPVDVFHLGVATRLDVQPGLADAVESINDLSNLMTLLAAAASARQPPRAFLRSGSIAEYGPAADAAVEGQREAPKTPYAASLAAGTHYLQMLQPRLPFRGITARLALVYGVGQSQAFFIPQTIERLASAQAVTLRRPDDRRDLIHVDDAIDGLLTLVDASQPCGGAINIATGIAPTMHEVAYLIATAIQADPRLVQIAASGTQTTLVASPGLASSQFGWRPRIPIAEGLRTLTPANMATACQDKCTSWQRP